MKTSALFICVILISSGWALNPAGETAATALTEVDIINSLSFYRSPLRHLARESLVSLRSIWLLEDLLMELRKF